MGEQHERTLRLAHQVLTHGDVTLLSESISKYLRERKPHITKAGYSQKDKQLHAFAKWLRNDCDVTSITKKVAGRYVSDMLQPSALAPKSRARRIAWTGAIVSALVIGAIGLMASLLSHAWIQIFSNAPAVVEAGSAYLVRVAPFYALFGVGMSLYFASQGAGKMAWPFTAGVMRLGVLLAGGLYWVEKSHGSLNGLYWIVAASYFVFGSINTFALARGRGWGERSARSTIPESAGRA